MKKTFIIIVLLILTSCTPWEKDGIYTLYRASMLGADLRIHMATFDSSDGKEYNQENCRIAADLFQQQPGVTVRYWCEKGSYRK